MIPRLTRVKKTHQRVVVAPDHGQIRQFFKETWRGTDCVHLSCLRHSQKHAIRLVGVLIFGIQMQQLVGNDILQWEGGEVGEWRSLYTGKGPEAVGHRFELGAQLHNGRSRLPWLSKAS